MFTNPLWYLNLMCITSNDQGGSSGDNTPTPSTPSNDTEGSAADGESADSTGSEDRGYPKDKKIADMTPDEQAAYWKFHAQKWEGFARDRKDYNKVKKELDDIKRAQMSDQERALEDARAEARAEALAEAGTKLVEARLTGLLEGRGLDEKDVQDRLQFVDLSKFLTANGEVDAALVSNFLDGVAPSQDTSQRQVWPDMGQGRRGNPAGQTAGGSVQAGRDLYANRHKKPSEN